MKQPCINLRNIAGWGGEKGGNENLIGDTHVCILPKKGQGHIKVNDSYFSSQSKSDGGFNKYFD